MFIDDPDCWAIGGAGKAEGFPATRADCFHVSGDQREGKGAHTWVVEVILSVPVR